MAVGLGELAVLLRPLAPNVGFELVEAVQQRDDRADVLVERALAAGLPRQHRQVQHLRVEAVQDR